MALVLLLFAFGLLGYVVARSQSRGRVDASAGNTTAQIRDLGTKTAGWIGSQLGFGDRPVDLRLWAADTLELPGDVRAWIMNLSSEEAAVFHQALDQHGNTLGLDLAKFFSGTADQTPDQHDAYIEAVAVYSRAYRKAREAQEQEAALREAGSTAGTQEQNASGQDGQDETPEGKVIEGKVVAEKRLSRRRRGSSAPEESGASV